MTAYDFEQIIERRGTDSLKWDNMQIRTPQAGPQHLPFWLADMDFACPPEVIQALQERVAHGVFGYTQAPESLYRSISGWYQRRFNWHIPESSLFYAPGVITGLSLLLKLTTRPGDGVIIQPPVFQVFRAAIEGAGCVVVNNPLVALGGGDYRFGYRQLLELTKRHKLLILCSPHNPVGRVWKRAELQKILEICHEQGVLVICDEIHHDFVRRGQEHFVLETLRPELKGQIITCTAPTKTFNLAGLQFGNVVIHDPLLQARWQRLVEQQYQLASPNALSISAVQAAYDAGEPWLEALLTYLDANFAAMQQFLAAHLPQCVFKIPEGTYLAWLDLRAYGFDQELADLLVTEGKILLEDGTLYGEADRGFVRFNAACPRSRLIQGLQALADVINRHRPKQAKHKSREG